jgi:hypothetical protein
MLSFSMNWTSIMNTASGIINGLLPIYMVPLGIILGMGLLGYIVKSIKGAIHAGG